MKKDSKSEEIPLVDSTFCACHSLEHQVAISYDEELNLVFLNIHLIDHKSFLKRFISGVKYIFGYKSRFGHWDEFLIDSNNSKVFQKNLNKLKSWDLKQKQQLQ